ncbi:MAG: hypothetical protein K2J54_01325, partial [Clostridia bacterium]|nr:hypothetical protein [Clostridia bacterium]
GGVYRSPFTNVNLTECDEKIKRSVFYAAEVVLAELKHLKNYLALFLNTFNQKISTFTSKKLNGLVQIVKTLSGNDLKAFFSCDEREFYTFYNANLRYDAGVKNWLVHFKGLADLGKFADKIDDEIAGCGGDWQSSKILTTLVKRICHLARTPVKEGEELDWVRAAMEI